MDENDLLKLQIEKLELQNAKLRRILVDNNLTQEYVGEDISSAADIEDHMDIEETTDQTNFRGSYGYHSSNYYLQLQIMFLLRL